MSNGIFFVVTAEDLEKDGLMCGEDNCNVVFSEGDIAALAIEGFEPWNALGIELVVCTNCYNKRIAV